MPSIQFGYEFASYNFSFRVADIISAVGWVEQSDTHQYALFNIGWQDYTINMKVYLEQETGIVEEHFALIYAPKRGRKRFPENCVDVMDSEQAALDGASPEASRHPAVVIGPSRSSEGFRLYYLVRWLD